MVFWGVTDFVAAFFTGLALALVGVFSKLLKSIGVSSLDAARVAFFATGLVALEGLTDLVNTIKQVHANLNKDLKIIGLLRVMFDPRITLQQQVSDQLKAHFGDKVFNTLIPRNVRLAEAPSYGLPGVVFDPSAKGSLAFIDFAKELVHRFETV